jgi:hypothetical protein
LQSDRFTQSQVNALVSKLLETTQPQLNKTKPPRPERVRECFRVLAQSKALSRRPRPRNVSDAAQVYVHEIQRPAKAAERHDDFDGGASVCLLLRTL